MEWKYRLIFLTILLCLVNPFDSIAQYCLSMKYDKNGNRIEKAVNINDDKEETKDIDNVMSYEISENELEDRILVYPNPNQGYFNIEVSEDEGQTLLMMELYNNIGVLLETARFTKNVSIDISDYSSGIYILKIIKGDMICNKIVVKH